MNFTEHKISFTSFVFVIVLCGTVHGQEKIIRFENFGKQYRFENLVFSSIAQDSIGFMWFGSHNGLYRYDGRNFFAFKSNVNDSNSLPNNFINCILPAADGNLWIGTRGGVIYYRQSTHRFFAFNNSNSTLSNNDVYALAYDVNGNIWAGTMNGLNCMRFYSDSQGKVTLVNNRIFKNDGGSNAISDNKIWDIVFDQFGFGWIATQKGLNRFSPADKEIRFHKFFANNKNPVAITLNYNWKLSYDKKRIWIISTDSAIDYVIPQNNSLESEYTFHHLLPELLKQIKIPLKHNYYLKHDSNDNYWLSNESDGVLFFNLDSDDRVKSFQLLNHTEENPASLVSSSAWYSYEDQNKNIWVATWDGLSKFNYSRLVFQQFDFKKNSVDASKYSVNCMTQPDTNFTIAGSNENVLLLMSKTSTRLIPLKIKNKPFMKESLRINCLLIHANGNLYCGTHVGIYILKKTELKKCLADNSYDPEFERIIDTTNSKSKFIMSMAEEKDGSILLGTGQGLYELNTLSEKIKILYNGNRSENIIRQVIIDPVDQSTWCASDNGLHHFIQQKNYTYQNKAGDQKSLSSNALNAICFDNEKNLWIGSVNGLSKFNRTENSFTSWQVSDAISTLNILSVVAGNDNHVYCGTDNGLAVFDPTTNEFRIYNTNDGLFSDKFNQVSVFKSETGLLFFGTIKGFNSFYPKNISINNHAPTNRILDIKVYDKSIFTENNFTAQRNQFALNQDLVFSYSQNFLTIDYAALDFKNPELNEFKYQLEELDSGWIGPVNYTSIRYPGIQPGHYVFKIKSANSDGVWSQNAALLNITITPPWYQTWWFRIFGSVAMLTIIIAVVRYLSQQKLKERLAEVEKLAALEHERNRISRDIHDDLGAGLSSVAMMTNQMKQLVTDDHARDRAWEISNEANDLVSRMREIIWSMSSKNDTVENLVAYINKYSFNYLEKNFIECKIMGEKNFPSTMIDGDSRRNIFLVVKESLHNIIKHSGATEVIFNYDITANNLKLTICDNGKGFDMANIHRFGNGLVNMKQRMEKAGGTYNIESSLGKGVFTTLTIAFNASSQN